tara:strand:- start:23946 stop:24695 length:750 start_codon:yes stop_codon:yes gene_type:complete
MTLYPTHFHPLDVNVTSVEFEGTQGDEFLEITDWPAFILWAKVVVRYREHDAADDSVFASVLSVPTKPILNFDPAYQLIPLNTTDTNQSDEWAGHSVYGFHPFAEFGIQVYRQMRMPATKDAIDSRVTITVAWVAKNDYAGAYDNPEWWKGNRWDAACGRSGSDFLSGYGAYPDATGDNDAGDAEGDGDDIIIEAPDPTVTPPPETDGGSGGEGNSGFGYLSTETASNLTNSAFLQISTYPTRDDETTY